MEVAQGQGLLLGMAPVVEVEALAVLEYQEQVVLQLVEPLAVLVESRHSQDVLAHMILLLVKVLMVAKAGVIQPEQGGMQSMVGVEALAHIPTLEVHPYMEQEEAVQ